MDVKLLDLAQQWDSLRNEIRQAIDEVCDSQQLILGPHVERFETSLANYCGTKHAIGVSSGTDALLCTLMALGIGPGDEVICPSFTFFATAGSIARVGATPVFVEIDPATFNLDPDCLAEKITAKTKAIMPVHLFGQTARMDAINEIACRHNLPVIEDAAQAIGARRQGKAACAWGIAGCLSFYPTKNLGALGDAGAVCTNSDELAEKIRKLRVHGSGHTYHHEMIGGMFRLAAIQAAALSVKLKHLNAWHEARRRNAAIYDQAFAGSTITPPAIEAGNQSIYNQYVVRVKDRDNVKKALAARSIGSAVYYPLPLHLQPCFAYLGYRRGDLPISERACEEVLALPVYPELEMAQVEHVAQVMREICD